MAAGDEDLAFADAAFGVASEFIEFDTNFPQEPVLLGDIIAFTKALLAKQAEEAAGQASEFISTVNNEFLNTNITDVTDSTNVVKETLDGINQQVESADQQATDSVNALFDPLKGFTTVTTFPVLDLLSSVQTGAIEFSDLPGAVAGSIMSNISLSLDFLQNNNIADVSQKASAILEATVESGKGLIDAVTGSAGSMIAGIQKTIDEAVELVIALVLDPIAALLAAILEAIRDIPKSIINVFLETLLQEATNGLASP